MPSSREGFWDSESFVVIGDSNSGRAFPKLAYGGLKDLGTLPGPVSAAVVEVPKDQTATWVGRVADAGIKNVWLHQQTDTPEALALAEERGLRAEHGTCAVMYVKPGFNGHAFHRWIMKLTGKF